MIEFQIYKPDQAQQDKWVEEIKKICWLTDDQFFIAGKVFSGTVSVGTFFDTAHVPPKDKDRGLQASSSENQVQDRYELACTVKHVFYYHKVIDRVHEGHSCGLVVECLDETLLMDGVILKSSI